MTRREELVHLACAHISGSGHSTSYDKVVSGAMKLLAEIERVCPEAATCPTCTASKQAVVDAVERCASIAERYGNRIGATAIRASLEQPTQPVRSPEHLALDAQYELDSFCAEAADNARAALRQYGNKDCTAMADEAMANPQLRRDTKCARCGIYTDLGVLCSSCSVRGDK